MICRCRQGAAEAWNELFDLHYAATGRFIYQLGSDFTREDVEEICQEVFLSVVKNLLSFNGKSRLRSWIFRIAINRAHDYRAERRAAKRGGGQMPLSLQAEGAQSGWIVDPPSADPGPDLSLVQAEDQALIGRALAQLSEPWREVIQLRYFGDLSYEEIARDLNLNPKTVSSRLSKSLDRLESMMRRLAAREKSDLVPA